MKPTQRRLFNINKNAFQIFYLVLIILNFHCRSKQYETTSRHPHSLMAFQQYKMHDEKHCGLGDLNIKKKQNLQIYIH
jgi:hypothetical protein